MQTATLEGHSAFDWSFADYDFFDQTRTVGDATVTFTVSDDHQVGWADDAPYLQTVAGSFTSSLLSYDERLFSTDSVERREAEHTTLFENPELLDPEERIWLSSYYFRAWTLARFHHPDGVSDVLITTDGYADYDDFDGSGSDYLLQAYFILAGPEISIPEFWTYDNSFDSPLTRTEISSGPFAEGQPFSLIAAANGEYEISGVTAGVFATADEAGSRIEGDAGIDTLIGGAGDDRLRGFGDLDRIDGGAGNDRLSGGDGADTVRGGDGDDVIGGGGGADVIDAGNGNDTVGAGTGDDSVDGQAGDDEIGGGAGHDTLDGGDGDDSLYGGMGDDEIHGRGGDNRIQGAAGNDFLVAGDGNDLLAGGSGIDEVYAGEGNDTIGGGFGNDGLIAGEGNDNVAAGAGADFVIGDDGNDILRGGYGADTLNGGEGADTMIGGPGSDMLVANFWPNAGGTPQTDDSADVFVYTNRPDQGHDEILGFTVEEDILQIDFVSSRDDLDISQNGDGELVIAFGTETLNTRITLPDLTLEDAAAILFVFG